MSSGCCCRNTQRGTGRGHGPPRASRWATAGEAARSAGTTPEAGRRECPSHAAPSRTRSVPRAACSCACDARPARSSSSAFPSPSAAASPRRPLVDLLRIRSSRDSRACERASGWMIHCSPTVVVGDAEKSRCWCRRNRNRNRRHCRRLRRRVSAGREGASLLDLHPPY